MFKRMLYVLALVLGLLAPLASPVASQSEPPRTEQAKDCVVYVTRTGHRYHRAGCRYLRRSAFKTTRSAAIAHGFTPCLICGGSECEPQ
jgi:hypothetical protein